MMEILAAVAAVLALGAAVKVWLDNRRLAAEFVAVYEQLEALSKLAARPPASKNNTPAVPERVELSATDIKRLRKDFDSLYAPAGTVPPDLSSQLNALKASIGNPELLPPLSEPVALADAGSTAKDRFCSVINAWLLTPGRGPRAGLLTQLRKAGFDDCSLASLEGLTEAQQDPTNPLLLEPKADGWWALASCGDGAYFACPLDPAFVSQGNLSLVRRWYEGPAEFASLESPAVVRRQDTNYYAVRTRGTLGAAPPARVTSSPKLSPPSRRSPTLAAPTLVNRLAVLLEEIKLLRNQQQSMLDGIEARKGEMQGVTVKLATALARLGTAEARYSKLSDEIQELKQRPPVVPSVPALPAIVEPDQPRTALAFSAAAGADAAKVAPVMPASAENQDPPWSAVFEQAGLSSGNVLDHGSTRDYLNRLKEIALLSNGQIIRCVRKNSMIGVTPLPDVHQIPEDRNVFTMVVGRLLPNGCWEAVPPKGEIPIESTATAYSFLLETVPDQLVVRGVSQPAVWEPRGGDFVVKQYLQLDSTPLG